MRRYQDAHLFYDDTQKIVTSLSGDPVFCYCVVWSAWFWYSEQMMKSAEYNKAKRKPCGILQNIPFSIGLPSTTLQCKLPVSTFSTSTVTRTSTIPTTMQQPTLPATRTFTTSDETNMKSTFVTEHHRMMNSKLPIIFSLSL
jgi:hypothetical protein